MQVIAMRTPRIESNENEISNHAQTKSNSIKISEVWVTPSKY